jgi:RNA polymerase sigma-70 factor (ECF subfamily)
MVKELVERIRQKDQRAMSQLYQMYIGELSSVCYRYVPSGEDAKDVLQNSFVKIFTSLPTIDYRSEEALRGWMRRIVVNEALLFLRERRKLHFEPIMSQTTIQDDEEPESEQMLPDVLHRLVSELPDGYRTVLNLYVFEGYSHRQIAELLGITESTSASQLYFAKRLLGRRIKELTDSKR